MSTLPQAPQFQTSLPGPNANGDHRARRHRRVAVVHAQLSLRHRAWRGGDGRGRRRQRLPRLRRRHRGELDRALAPGGRRRDRRAGGPLPAHVRHGLLLRTAGAARGGAVGDRADARPVPVVLRQLRRRGQRGGDQAGALSLEALVPDRVHGLLPRPDAGSAVAHREPRRAAQGLRAGDRARRVPRAVSRRLPRRSRRGGAVARVPRGQDLRAPGRARRGGGDRRRADPGGGRVSRAAARVPAATAGDRRSTRHPADRRRGAGRHGPHGPHVRDRAQRRAARHHHDGQGHCLRECRSA